MEGYITKNQAIHAMEQVTQPECFIENTRKDFAKIIEKLPAADVVEVVRCKDCKHSNQYGGGCWYCEKYEGLFSAVNPNDYCSYGWDGDQQ